MTILETNMIVIRIGQTYTFTDAAEIPSYEAQDYDLTLTITGTLHKAEPDVGIPHNYIEDITAFDNDGDEIFLTDAEMETAEKLLLESQ